MSSARLCSDCEVQFAAYKQFCDDTTVEKQRAIKEANAKMEQLSAAIQKATALWQRLERSCKVLSKVQRFSQLRGQRFRCAQYRG